MYQSKNSSVKNAVVGLVLFLVVAVGVGVAFVLTNGSFATENRSQASNEQQYYFKVDAAGDKSFDVNFFGSNGKNPATVTKFSFTIDLAGAKRQTSLELPGFKVQAKEIAAFPPYPAGFNPGGVRVTPPPQGSQGSCVPRPACLDSNPPCRIAQPENGFCPASPPSSPPATSPAQGQQKVLFQQNGITLTQGDPSFQINSIILVDARTLVIIGTVATEAPAPGIAKKIGKEILGQLNVAHLTFKGFTGTPSIAKQSVKGYLAGLVGTEVELTSLSSPSSNSGANPQSSCIPRPACLDSRPACMIAVPVGGFCPKQ